MLCFSTLLFLRIFIFRGSSFKLKRATWQHRNRGGFLKAIKRKSGSALLNQRQEKEIEKLGEMRKQQKTKIKQRDCAYKSQNSRLDMIICRTSGIVGQSFEFLCGFSIRRILEKTINGRINQKKEENKQKRKRHLRQLCQRNIAGQGSFQRRKIFNAVFSKTVRQCRK